MRGRKRKQHEKKSIHREAWWGIKNENGTTKIMPSQFKLTHLKKKIKQKKERTLVMHNTVSFRREKSQRQEHLGRPKTAVLIIIIFKNTNPESERDNSEQ